MNDKEYQNVVQAKIKENIKRLRIENNLSMRDVAASLGIKENTYRIWESPNKSCPKAHDIYRLAKAYNVSVDFILGNSKASTGGVEMLRVEEIDNFPLRSSKYVSELDRYERLIIMKIRQLNFDERQQLNNFLTNLLSDDINNK